MIKVDYDELIAKRENGEISDWKAGLLAGLKAGLNPIGSLAELAKTLTSLGGLTSDDVENVSRIIEAGQREGADEMDIEMNRESWLGLQGKIDGNDNVEIGFGSGGSTGYKINVKYK